MIDPSEITERMRLAGEEWADADYAASLLEETKKSVLAELMNAMPSNLSMAAKESVAVTEAAFKLHVVRMVAARRDANKAKVRYDSAKAWIELTRTAESSRRQEMKL